MDTVFTTRQGGSYDLTHKGPGAGAVSTCIDKESRTSISAELAENWTTDPNHNPNTYIGDPDTNTPPAPADK